MELTSDVLLKGRVWANTIDSLAPIFKTRTNYSLYMLCIAIGIMYDERIQQFEEDAEENESPRNVPRNVMQNNDNGRLDFMFQAAILSTKTENLSEEDRLKLAFGEESEDAKFNKLGFLTEFANFGVTKLSEKIGDTVVESMENIRTFLTTTVEGMNYEISPIPDDVWLSDL